MIDAKIGTEGQVLCARQGCKRPLMPGLRVRWDGNGTVDRSGSWRVVRIAGQQPTLRHAASRSGQGQRINRREAARRQPGAISTEVVTTADGEDVTITTYAPDVRISPALPVTVECPTCHTPQRIAAPS